VTQPPEPADAGVPFAVAVVDVTYGQGAGFGQDELPGIVLGPPQPKGRNQGSTHVLSLGRNGTITLQMGADITNGPGPDFVVFENAFLVDGTTEVFVEPGQVSVSDDGVLFFDFPCDATAAPYAGCAGITPTLAHDNSLSPTNADEAGGDAFDLDLVGLSRARFVRITDQSSTAPFSPTAGFDLDAVSVILTRTAF